MIGKPITAAMIQLALAAIGALLLVIAGLSAYIWGVPIIGGGLRAEVADLTDDLGDMTKERDDLIADGERRTKAGREALQEAQSKRPVVDSQIEAIRAEGGATSDCATNPAVMGADL